MPHDHHDHSHSPAPGTVSPFGHPYRQDNGRPFSYWQNMEIAIRELLVEKGHVTTIQIQNKIDKMDAHSPTNGANVVARAWTDPEFKAALKNDAAQATRDMGFDIGPMHLIAVENSDMVHNVVVCTLCSCYPRNLLGLPPDWYKSRAYRSRTVIEPRKVLTEFGLVLSENVQVRVHDSTAEMSYIVIPAQPEASKGLPVHDLVKWVTRDSMIGVGKAHAPI